MACYGGRTEERPEIYVVGRKRGPERQFLALHHVGEVGVASVEIGDLLLPRFSLALAASGLTVGRVEGLGPGENLINFFFCELKDGAGLGEALPVDLVNTSERALCPSVVFRKVTNGFRDRQNFGTSQFSFEI